MIRPHRSRGEIALERRRFIKLMALGSVTLPLLAACGGPPAAGPSPTPAGQTAQPAAGPTALPSRPSATLTVAQDGAFAVLDPAGAGKVRAEPEILRHLYSNLVRFTPSMSIEPDLAESWSVGADGRTWAFKLRRGVKFHDGSEFTAEAVKFTFDRLLDEKKAFLNRGLFAPVIAGVRAVDPVTVEIVTKSPFGPLLNYLAHHSAGIVSPAAVQQHGDDFALHPVGTGPYRAAELSPGERIVLVRDPDYFGAKPKTDQLVFRAIIEEGARTAALESGQVDIATGLPAQDAARLKGAGFSIVAAPSLQAQYLGINVQRPGLRDRGVRQALNYAVDKQTIVRTIFLDTYSVADSVLTPGSFGYQRQGAYEYDPARAKELLASAGIGPGNSLKLVLWTPEGLYPKDIVVAQAIQAQLKEVGVDVQIQKQESATYFSALKKPLAEINYDLFMWAFVPSTGDGYQTFQNNLLSDDGDVPSYFNYSRYKNAQLDDLIKQAGTETDQQKRAEFLSRAQRIVWEDPPYVYLYVISIVNGYRKSVTGVEALPTRYMDLTAAVKG